MPIRIFLLSYYSMAKQYNEILQESDWQKGQVYFFKKYTKKHMLVVTCSFCRPSPTWCTPLHLPPPPNHWRGGITPSTFRNLSCLLLILPLLFDFILPIIFRPQNLMAFWEEPHAPHEDDRTRAPRFALNWNLPPRCRDSNLIALTARQLDQVERAWEREEFLL